MPVRLCIGDAVLVYLSDDHEKKKENIQIGVIKYIGLIDGFGMTEYVGIDLVETTENGHQGTINGVQYFQSGRGHGIHTRIANVIRKLAASEVSKKMQEIIALFKGRLDEYAQALTQRDEYIEELKNTQKSLKRLLREHGAEGDLDALNSAHTIGTKHVNMRMISRESPSFSFMPGDNKFPSTIKPHQMSSVGSEDTMSIGSGMTDLTLLDQRRKDSGLITLNTIDEQAFQLTTPDALDDNQSPITPYNQYSPRSDSELILHNTIGSMATAAASPVLGHKALSNDSTLTSSTLTSKALGLKTRYGGRNKEEDEDRFPDTDAISHQHRRRGRDRVKTRKGRHRLSSSVGSISTARLSRVSTQDTFASSNYTHAYIRKQNKRKKKSSKQRRKQKSRKKKSSKSKRHGARRKKYSKKRSRKQTERSDDSYSSSEVSYQSGSCSSEEDSSASEGYNSPPSRRKYGQIQSMHKQSSQPQNHNRHYVLGHTQHTSHPGPGMNREPHPIQRPQPIQRPLPILPNNPNRMQVNRLTPVTPTSPMGSVHSSMHVNGNTSLPNSPLQSWTQHVSAVVDTPTVGGTRQRHGHGRGSHSPATLAQQLGRAQSGDPQQHYYTQQQRQPQQQQQQQQQPQVIRPGTAKFMKPVPELRQKSLKKGNPKPKRRIAKSQKRKSQQNQRKDSCHRRSVSWNPMHAVEDHETATQMQQNNHIMRAAHHAQNPALQHGHMPGRRHPGHDAAALQKPARHHVVQYSYDHNNNVYYPQPQIDDWMQQQMHMQHAPGRSQHYL